MNPTDLAKFNQAVSLAQSNQKSLAYVELKKLHPANSSEPNLLLWLAFTSPDFSESEQLIGQASELAPNNADVVGARQWLQAERAKLPIFSAAPPPPPPVTFQPQTGNLMRQATQVQVVLPGQNDDERVVYEAEDIFVTNSRAILNKKPYDLHAIRAVSLGLKPASRRLGILVTLGGILIGGVGGFLYLSMLILLGFVIGVAGLWLIVSARPAHSVKIIYNNNVIEDVLMSNNTSVEKAVSALNQALVLRG